jgi:hypothetical protein
LSHPRSKRDRQYATKAKFKAFVEQARELGLTIDGVEFVPDGTIRILTNRSGGAVSADAEYDAWKAGGN